MNYSDRLMIIRLYRKWMDEIYSKDGIRPLDNYETFLVFLSLKGFLKEGEKKDE